MDKSQQKDELSEEENQIQPQNTEIDSQQNQSKRLSVFTVFGHIDVCLSIVAFVFVFVRAIKLGTLTWTITITLLILIVVSGFFSSLMLYALGDARERICYLEDEIGEIKSKNKK